MTEPADGGRSSNGCALASASVSALSARAPNKDKARIGRASLTRTGDIDAGWGRGTSRKLANTTIRGTCLDGLVWLPQLFHCHIGWKRSNRLIASGSWVGPLSEPSSPSHPCHPCRRQAWPESQNPSSVCRQPWLPLLPAGQRPNSRPVRRPSRPWRGR